MDNELIEALEVIRLRMVARRDDFGARVERNDLLKPYWQGKRDEAGWVADRLAEALAPYQERE